MRFQDQINIYKILYQISYKNIRIFSFPYFSWIDNLRNQYDSACNYYQKLGEN